MARIIIHFGMPKTGTSALQHLLAASGAALALSKTTYPAEFRRPGTDAHHLLVECVREIHGKSAATILQRFYDFLAANRKMNVLISSEAFTNCFSNRHVSQLVQFLARCRSSHTVCGLMTLRRMDLFLESMYLHSSKVGTITSNPDEYVEARNSWISNLFEQIGRVKTGDVADEFRFFKYEAARDFNRALTTAMGLPTAREQPTVYHNRRLGLKAQTVLLFLDELSRECGATLARGPLMKAMESGRFVFPEDTRDYTIFTSAQREHVRRLSLAAAEAFGVTEYCDFFGSELINDPTYHDLSLGNLKPSDIALLKAFASSRKSGLSGRKRPGHHARRSVSG